MKSTRLLSLLAFALPCLTGVPALRADDTARTVVIVANDSMKFSVTSIAAAPGETIHVQLRNEGTLPKESMGHNWVLLVAGADPVAFAMAAMTARDTDYIPKALAAQVLAKTPLLGAKETGDVTFTCPAKPGKYPYLCSFSGHALAGMRGELVVK